MAIQQWEYLRILIVPDTDTPFGLKQVLINGDNILDEPYELGSQAELQRYIFRLFNKLGKHGWELVSSGDGLYHFKRPNSKA